MCRHDCPKHIREDLQQHLDNLEEENEKLKEDDDKQ